MGCYFVVFAIGDLASYQFEYLRAQALLHGADPLVTGSSRSLVCINPSADRSLHSFGYEANRLCSLAFDKYLKLQPEERKNVRLADSVRKRFAELKAERLKQLSEAEF